ncbi:aspartate/glutamate racemase family protein [Mycoplasmatota bacterium WC44]
MKIGIIDSGIGGLTIFRKLIEYFPGHSFFYVADKEHFPYGEKTKNEIVDILEDIVDIFKRMDLIVIACFTASSYVREVKTDKKIVTVIDVINDHLEKHNYKDVSIIGTKHSINSNLFKKPIKERINGQELINQIEMNCVYDYDWLNDIDSESLIMGCTHFNYLPELKIKAIRSDDLIVDFIKKSLQLE